MSLTWVAATLALMIAFTGLATDTGLVWISRTQLQHAVDAAALAGAQDLPTQSAAQQTACTYASQRNGLAGMFGKNSTCSGKADVAFPSSTSIRVTAYRTVQPIFGSLVGFKPVTVNAKATAIIGSLGGACVFPFFLTVGQITNPTFYAPVKFTNANTAGGAIDVGSGANAIRDAMVNRSCSHAQEVVVNGSISTKPGALDQFKAGWDTIATCAATYNPPAGTTCPTTTSVCKQNLITGYLVSTAAGYTLISNDPSPAPTGAQITISNCPRLVLVPVLPDGDYKGGSTTAKIQGFVPFYFAFKCGSNTCNDPTVGAMSRNDFWGYFVKLNLSSDKYSTYKPEYGTQVVALTN